MRKCYDKTTASTDSDFKVDKTLLEVAIDKQTKRCEAGKLTVKNIARLK